MSSSSRSSSSGDSSDSSLEPQVHVPDQDQGEWLIAGPDGDIGSLSVSDDSSSDSSSDGDSASQPKPAQEDAEPEEKKAPLKKRARTDRNLEDITTGQFDDYRTIFAGGLAYQAEKADIESFFNEVGPVTRLRMLQWQGKSNGAAFIEYESAALARRAVAMMDGESFLGRTVRLNLATEKPGGVKGFSVYVGNLNFITSEKTLRAIFSHCGDIVRVKLPLFRDTGRLRGFAIVDLDTDAARQRALRLHGMVIDGREARVEIMEKEDKKTKKARRAIPAFRRAEKEDQMQARKQQNPKLGRNRK